MADLNKIKNPHDLFFKANMQDLRVARSFFEANLPEELTQQINFDTLKLRSDSFVSPELKSLLSDLVYSVMINNKSAYLYIISEHQSTVPEMMPFRKLQYNCALWDLHLKQTPKGKPKLLPVIINIVFYHGKVTPYAESCDIYDYFIGPAFAREWAFKPFFLIDVNQIPDEELAKQKWAAIFQLMQKHSRERDMLPFLEKLLKGELSLEIHQYGDLLYLMVKYLAETGEISDKRKFVELLKQALPEGEQKMTTLAQDWLKEGEQLGYQKGIHVGMEQGIEKGIHVGMEQGIEKGIEKGVQKGEHEKAIAIAKNLFLQGVDVKIIKFATSLSDQELAELFKAH